MFLSLNWNVLNFELKPTFPMTRHLLCHHPESPYTHLDNLFHLRTNPDPDMWAKVSIYKQYNDMNSEIILNVSHICLIQLTKTKCGFLSVNVILNRTELISWGLKQPSATQMFWNIVRISRGFYFSLAICHNYACRARSTSCN